MEIRQLEYFVTCVREGSLTKAAEALYTSQPHVSQVIGTLENELGAQLFRRGRGGIMLTKEGEQILFYAENILKNASLIRETVEARPRQELRIAANPSSRMARRTAYFFENEKDNITDLLYTECGVEEMTELVAARQYDLGFLFVPDTKRTAFQQIIEKRRLRFHPLLTSGLVIYCGPKNPLYGKPSVTTEELDGMSCIQMEDDFFAVEDILMEDIALRKRKAGLRKTVRTNSNRLIARMLKETELINIGSYWSKSTAGMEMVKMTPVEGYEDRILFGYIEKEGVPRPEEAETFLRMLQK